MTCCETIQTVGQGGCGRPGNGKTHLKGSNTQNKIHARCWKSARENIKTMFDRYGWLHVPSSMNRSVKEQEALCKEV